MKMNQKQVEQYAKDFLWNEYGMSLMIPIKINGRMTRTMGQFRARNGIAKEIHISKMLLQYNTLEEIKDTIRHECIHYALYELELPWRDRDATFQKHLRMHGCRTNGGKYRGKVHVYACTNCNNSFTTKRRFNTSKFNCAKCKANGLTYCETKIVS